MPRGRRRTQDQEAGVSSPAQQDEAEVVAEAGAERDEELGELMADEERVRTLGAVDAESIRENRRLGDIVNKRRANMKGVPFNVDDMLTKYETLIKFWPANTIDINIKRLTGSPIQTVITSRPRSGVDLYKAINDFHGAHEEAKYEIKFFDNNSKQFRGTGQITMPDTHVNAPQTPPMTYPHNPYGPPPGYPAAPPPGYPPPAYGMPPTPPPAPAPQPQPVAPQVTPAVHVMPPAFDPNPVMAMMQQMLGMFEQMRASAQPPPQPPQPPQPQLAYPPAMPPPPSSQDPAAMLEWMQRAFQIFQQMQSSAGQGTATGGVAPAQPPPQASGMNPMMAAAMGVPPMQPPPGMMWVPGIGFVPIEALMRAISGSGGGDNARQGAPGTSATYRDRVQGQGYRGGPPPYGPSGEGESPPRAPYGYQPPPPPARPQSPMDEFRNAVGVVRQAINLANEFSELMPNGASQEPPPPVLAAVEDDGPIKIIDTGFGKLVINNSDGALRKWETGWANMDKILKWGGEQIDAISRAASDRQRPQQRHVQQLPSGYVEVTPGYQPPPGYVVGPPLDPQALPPPPAYMPPPIQPQQRQPWGPPPVPGAR